MPESYFELYAVRCALTPTLNLPVLASYIGFFCILWFTWAQVTLYDVRFATDSFFERIAHACHFGAMVGFAIIGPQFLLEHDGWGPLQQLSIMLAVDRVVLACQYTSTLVFVWRHRTMRTPMIIVIASLVVAAAIYLGVSFAYYRQTTYDAYFAWYVVAVIEVGINLVVAAYSEPMSFKKTQIVERMSCLTLIIVRRSHLGSYAGMQRLIEAAGRRDHWPHPHNCQGRNLRP